MPYVVVLAFGHEISDERARLDLSYIHASLADAYWAAGRPRAATERSMAHCLCFGVYTPAGNQVGFARLLTDFTFRAHLGDVFIDRAVRSLGLGKGLIEAILAHPELATVRNWTLKTRDAHGLYARYGFRAAVADPNWMNLNRPAPEGS